MKKYLISFILMVAGFGVANADEPVKGLFVTGNGWDTSYKLVDLPTIKYETVKGVNHAVLYLKKQAEPVLRLALADGKTLTITYGEYVPPVPNGLASEKVVITEQGGKKFIQGGKLIIIGKDGKRYNAAGVEIK